MKLFSVKGVAIRCQPLLLLLIPAAIMLNRSGALVIAFISLTVHELSHAIVAGRLGYNVTSIEIQPFGFVARMEADSALPYDAASIYAAGPVASLCMAAAFSLFERSLPEIAPYAAGFIEYNILIASVNLLPVLPLDGGRLLYAILCGTGRISRKRRNGKHYGSGRIAASVLCISGIAVGCFFAAISLLLALYGAFNPTFIIMGVFLIVAASCERRSLLNRLALGNVIMPKVKQGRGFESIMNVKHYAMIESTTIAAALSMLPVGSYGIVVITDSAMQRLGTMDELQLKQAATVLGATAKLGQCIEYARRIERV